MFIPAKKIEYLDDVKFNLYFLDGKIIQYDLKRLFIKYPQFKELKSNRDLFLNGKLDVGGYGIIWNEELDLSVMSVYECGVLMGFYPVPVNNKIGVALIQAREIRNLTQSELSKLTGIDQGDISKLEKGIGNPTVKKLQKLADGLNMELNIFFK